MKNNTINFFIDKIFACRCKVYYVTFEVIMQAFFRNSIKKM
ncbi:hypothetical protein FDUTEX481_09204 [Tolypothrix sp. PCC 7601]|nr:hypothetical protein FDUTEX481_09204 [Tolypothrix sp. PCC 7601]